MSTRVKADEQFARLLEIASPATAATDPNLGSLATLANALRAAGSTSIAPGPDPMFRAALRQRLVAVATVTADESGLATTRPTSFAGRARRGRAQRRLAALAGTFAIVTSIAGVGVAAAKSLPGDPFYGVKRATEQVQLWTARGDVAKGQRHLEFAQTRLAEARKLSPGSSHLRSTLAAMNTETMSASTDLIAAYTASKSTAPLADLLTFSLKQYNGLTKLDAALPLTVRAQEQSSVALLDGILTTVHSVSHGACVLCAVTGKPAPSGGVNPTRPGPASSTGPSKPTTTQPGRSRPTPTQSSGPTSSPTPSRTPSGILPTHLLPTQLPSVPLPIISTLLNPHHHKQPTLKLTPVPLISTLLGGLGL